MPKRNHRPLRRKGPSGLRRIQEAVAVAERVAVVETSGSMATTSTPGHVRIALIRAGWSLNGTYYSAEVLKQSAGKWRRGLQAFADHAPDSEEDDYPSGSIKNLAGVLTSDAVWNDATQSLEADVKLFAPWREALIDMAPYIGMSIRAWVYAEDGEAEGRRGLIVNSIAEARSVDFVTVPAAGGAILSVLESVRHGAREDANVGAWLESRLHLALTTYADDMYGNGQLTRPERIVLSTAIGDGLQAWSARVETDAPQLFQRSRWSYPDEPANAAEAARRAAEATVEERRADLADEISELYGGDQTYTWVRDFDPDKLLVWFDVCPADGDNSTWQQSYTVDADGGCELAGDRVEVVPRTVYDPAEPEDEPEVPDGTAEAAPAAEPEDVTGGTPPTVTDPPIEEETGMSGTQTGAPPVQAGTAPVVDTPPTTDQTGAAEANRAVLEAMQALTRQVTTLTDANTALVARVDRAEANERTARNRGAAREAVTAALNSDTVPGDLRAQIAPRVTETVLANIPVTDSGDVDTAALAEAITAAVAAESGYAADLLERAGVGRPRGLGESAKPQTGADFLKSLEEGFTALGMTPAAAKIAAQGRG